MNRRLSGKKRMTIRRLAAVALALGMVILYMPGLAYAEDSTDVTAESASATEAADTSSFGTSASGSAEKTADTASNSVSASESTSKSASKRKTVRRMTTSSTSQLVKDGVTYNLNGTEATEREVASTVTGDSNNVLTIPSTVTDADGKVYTVTAVCQTGNNKNIKKIVFPNTVKTISGYFNSWTGLTEFTVPSTVQTAAMALQYDTGLKRLTFEEGVTAIKMNSMVIGDSALTEINIPSSLRDIKSSYTFRGATGLTSFDIPEGMTFEGIGDFSDCTSLKSVTLPKSMTTIEGSAFGGCTALTKVTCKSPITEIGSYAFQDCSALVSAPFTVDAVKIGEGAFQECTALASVDLSAAETIGDGAFCQCYENDGTTKTGLAAVKLCDSLTSIGEDAFCHDYLLTDIGDLPDSLATIGSYAFWNCPLGKTLTIPDSVTEIGEGAFGNYNDNNSNIENIVIGNGLKTLNDEVFQNADKLKTVSIGSGIENISGSAFQDSAALKTSDTVITIDSSKDYVSVGDGAFGNATVIYKEASAGNTDDTIEDGGMTLQKAIDTAKDGGTVTIKKNVKLSTPVTVSGKSVTLKTSGDFQILPGQDFKGSLFDIAEGAGLTLDGGTGKTLTLNCRHMDGGPAVTDHGTFTLTNGDVQGASISKSRAGAILVCGKTAVMNMNGGTIEKNNVSGTSSGTIRVCDGGTLNMADGTIQNNTATAVNASSGVILYEGSTMNLKGGSITGNKGTQGSAILAYSTATDADKEAKLTISGGTISHNSSKCTSSSAMGAVTVLGNASLDFSAGEISDNSVTGYCACGGGICVYDFSTAAKDTDGYVPAPENYITKFTMTGGTVSGNSAARSGGGIYVQSLAASISGGTISGNKAGFMGGGIYGGLGAKPNLKLSNMAVYSNTASTMGGGLYSCPTGRIYLYGKGGGAVFGNKSNKVGDDISAERTMYKSDATTSYTTLSNSMLGGGIVHYYNDGVPVMSTTVNNVGNYSPAGARYNALDPGNEVTPNESTTPYLLKAVTTKDAEKMAEDAASLKITDNSASFGGGIATNASLTVGEKDKVWNLNVSKTWSGNKAKPASVTVDLIYDGKVIDTLKLSAKNDWKGIFKNLSEVMKGKVSISEESVSGWTVSVGGITPEKDGTDQSVTITNTESVTPPTPTPTAGTITVTKKTLNQSGQAVKVSGTFYITLFSDEKCTKIVGQTQSVAVKDGVPGTATFTGLATGKYYAAETNADGTKLITEPSAAGKYVGYDVTGNGTAVTLSAENPSGTAVITNVYSPAGHKTPKTPTNPETPTTPTTPTTPMPGSSQTGDDFNIGLWTLLAVLGLTGITVPVWLRKKRG